jgi:hypothetical protein
LVAAPNRQPIDSIKNPTARNEQTHATTQQRQIKNPTATQTDKQTTAIKQASKQVN